MYDLKMRKAESAIRATLIGALAVTSLIITPSFSYDPISIPKLSSLVIFSAGLLVILALNRSALFFKSQKNIVIIMLAFIIWSILSYLFSPNKTETFYGVTGRQTGLLTYISLVIIFLAAVVVGSNNLNLKVLNVLVYCGVISAIYGLIQYLGLEGISWINSYNVVIGFLGNPNFQSSFMGISATAAFALVNWKYKFKSGLYMSFIVIAIYVIYLTQSRQGYLVLLTGSSIVGYFFLRSAKKLSRILNLYFLVTIIGAITIISDMLQKSPWAPFIYKPSITYRGDFWRAGWNMTLDNPLFGVGFDGYRDNYRLYKDINSALRPIPDAVVDSAHNVFLDISTAGGFPLLFIYTTFIFYTFRSIIKIMKRSKVNDLALTGLVSCWIAYLAQSLISMNNIGIAIWGWAFSGLIIGYEINTRDNQTFESTVKKRYPRILEVSGFVIGAIIVFPQIIVDAQFRSAVDSKDYSKIYNNAKQWPQSVKRIVLISEDLRVAGFLVQSRELALEAIKLNPNNFEAWLALGRLSNSTPEELETAIKKLRELDPLNPGLK
jgi:O-antigen ligase